MRISMNSGRRMVPIATGSNYVPKKHDMAVCQQAEFPGGMLAPADRLNSIISAPAIP